MQRQWRKPRLLRGTIRKDKLHRNMKVMKFGGTSVGSVKSILSLKKIVETEARTQPVVVVVSSKRTGRYHRQTDRHVANGQERR